MTIHAVGLPGDRTLERFVTRASEQGHDVRLLDLGAAAGAHWRVTLARDGGEFVIQGDQDEHVLRSDAAYYVRTIDLSPVLAGDESAGWRHLVMALACFLDGARGTVVNRPGGHVHNGAKPLHEAWLARRGFAVPPSLTTSDRGRLIAFADRYGRVIVKAVSGTRGTAQMLDADAFAGFEVEAGPVHVQQVVAGFDVRAHLVGGEVFAERIDSTAVDYRASDAETEHTPVEVPEELVERMRSAAVEMGLLFTGWDFVVDAGGRWWCLEANPMPGYDVYDRRCDGAISSALCRLLEDAPGH